MKLFKKLMILFFVLSLIFLISCSKNSANNQQKIVIKPPVVTIESSNENLEDDKDAGLEKESQDEDIKEAQQKEIESVAKTTEDKEVTTRKLVEINMIANEFKFDPSTIEVNKGDKVKLNIESLDVDHGLSIPDFDIKQRLNKGEKVTVEFVADKTGTFKFFCSVYCGEGHGSMRGTLIVK